MTVGDDVLSSVVLANTSEQEGLVMAAFLVFLQIDMIP